MCHLLESPAHSVALRCGSELQPIVKRNAHSVTLWCGSELQPIVKSKCSCRYFAAFWM